MVAADSTGEAKIKTELTGPTVTADVPIVADKKVETKQPTLSLFDFFRRKGTDFFNKKIFVYILYWGYVRNAIFR